MYMYVQYMYSTHIASAKSNCISQLTSMMDVNSMHPYTKFCNCTNSIGIVTCKDECNRFWIFKSPIVFDANYIINGIYIFTNVDGIEKCDFGNEKEKMSTKNNYITLEYTCFSCFKKSLNVRSIFVSDVAEAQISKITKKYFVNSAKQRL